MGTQQPTFQSVSPVTGEVLATYESMADGDVDKILSRAAAAYRDWSGLELTERAAIAGRAGELLIERRDELAELATLEMGKPLEEAKEEVDFAAAIFSYYATKGSHFLIDQPLEIEAQDRAVIQRLPIGPILGVMPWNFPFYQVARFVAPNLVLGNTILLKHAESVPQCALALELLLGDAGLPQGAYQNLFATHGQIEQIIGDSRVQGVSLTGSERAGAAVATTAGKHLKKCVLELGGSDPYIILDSEDVAGAAQDAWEARNYNAGQACNSNKRLIVSSDIFEEFVAELVKNAQGLEPGDPRKLARGTYPPLSSRAAAERLDELVQEAVEQGATLHVGGQLGVAESAYYSPAVLTGVTEEMRAFREELFGPVAVVYSIDSDDEALRLANDSDYGLGGAVFSTDEARALKLASQLEVGMANVNIWAGEGAEVPFGGVKRSGFGRELGPGGIEEFANKRLLYVH